MTAVELLHVLDHSSTCNSIHCTFVYCRYMQQLSKHFSTCNKFPCKICKDMSDLTEVHARSCCQWKCAVVKCSTFKHSLQLSRSDPELKKESALKSLLINGINHLNDNVDMSIQQNSLDFAGSNMILLPRTNNNAQPLVLPKASVCTTVATCDSLEILCTNQMYNQCEGVRDVRTSSSSTSERGADLSKQVKKRRRRKSNISLDKALQEARRIDVLKKREELLHRKNIHCSAATTNIAVDNNTISTGNAAASRQSGRIGLGCHEFKSSLYSYCGVTDHEQHSGSEFNLTLSESEQQPIPSVSKGKRNFSKFSLESSSPSNLPHSTPTLSSSYLPWKVQTVQTTPQAARVTLVHPNPRYEPTQEQESYPDPLLESIDLLQHDVVDESESSSSGGSEYTWIASFFENEGLWL